MNSLNNNNNVVNYSIQNNNFQLQDDLSQTWHCENKDILEEPIGADRIFHVEGKSIKIHSYVMANASFYFRSFFYGNFKEKSQTEISIDECTYEEFKAIQGYIYSGRLELDTTNVLRIYQLALFFGISKLETHCIHFIKEALEDKSDYFNSHLNHLDDEHPLKIILNNFFTKKGWPGRCVKSSYGIVPLAPNEACFKKYKLLIGSRLTFVDNNYMRHTQTIVGVDYNGYLWAVDDRCKEGNAVQYSQIDCKSDLKKTNVKVINHNPHWVSKKEIEQNLQTTSLRSKFTKFIAKQLTSRNEADRWYCENEISDMKGSKVKLVTPYECYQEYGLSPGDIFVFKTTTDQGGIVEGMDEEGRLWFRLDNEKGASSIATKDKFYDHFKVIKENPFSPFSQNHLSINDTKDLILELSSQRDTNYDLTFHVENRKIYAHTSFLALRSPYFKTKLAQSKSNQIKIHNCPYKYFKTIIDYLYTGQIDCELPDIFLLYKMAIKMQISSLQKWCEAFLSTDLPANLFADYYAFIQYYPFNHPLKIALSKYIEKNKTALIKHFQTHPVELTSLSESGRIELLQYFKNDPLELFNIIDSYIRHQQGKIPSVSVQSLLQLVDFSKIPLTVLFSKVHQAGYLSDAKTLEYAKQNFSLDKFFALPTDGLIYVEEDSFIAKTQKIIPCESPTKCFDQYGFFPGDIVNTPKGEGIIAGIDKKNGCLWIKLKNDKGATYWDDPSNPYAYLREFKLIQRKLSFSGNNTIRNNPTFDGVYDLHIKDKILDPAINCDITFIVEGKEIRAHAKQFSERSLFFKDLLGRKFAKSWKIIPFNECSYQEFILLKNYIYTGEISLNFNNVVQLHNLADKFKLESLKEHCSVFFQKHLSEYNFIEYFMQLRSFSPKHPLKNLLIDFMKTNPTSLLNANRMIEFSSINLTEYEIFEFFGYFSEDQKHLFYFLHHFVCYNVLSQEKIFKLFEGINFESFSLEELFKWTCTNNINKNAYLSEENLFKWACKISNRQANI